MVERTLPSPGGQAAAAGARSGLLSPPRLFSELLLVAGAAVVQVGGTIMAAHNQPEYGSLGVAAALVLALGVLSLPMRHRFPVAVLGVTFGTTLTFVSLDNPGGPVYVALIAALAHVVLIGRRRVAITFLALGYVLFPWLGYVLGNTDRPNPAFLIGLAAWLVVLISVPEMVRSHRERTWETARSEAEAMRRQAADERVRIARDLHDSVAHNMSLISIQAGVALHLLEESRGSGGDGGGRGAEEQVRSSLAAIKDASKEALVELRSVLGVLRHVDEVDEGQASRKDDEGRADTSGRRSSSAGPRAPVPTLERLDSLMERSRSIGLDVTLELHAGRGTLTDLPRPVDLAAFRIIQESLTNVSRHSDSPTAVVRIGKRNGMLTVNILDEGTGQAVPRDLPGGGNGIIGMRERAAAVGGRLQAGPRPVQGFAVRAELPLDTVGDPDQQGEPETLQSDGDA